MPGDGPVLLGMSNMELLCIIRVMHETIHNKTNNRKFDMQTRHATDSPNCSTNKGPQAKSDADNMSGTEPKYLNSSTNKTQISDCF